MSKERDLWIQIRRLILSAVAILDRYYAVSTKVEIGENDSIATAIK